MKTLLNPKHKEQIIARLETVRLSNSRRWGKMSAQQMVCHLADSFRMYMGLTRVAPIRLPYPRSLLRCIALWVPFPWPKGFKTAPELDSKPAAPPLLSLTTTSVSF